MTWPARFYSAPGFPGIAIGSIRFMHDTRPERQAPHRPGAKSPTEQEALRSAAASVRAALETTMRGVPEELAEYRDVIAAQMELARDPKLLDAALARIEHKQICASWALDHTVEELCTLFRGMDDPYLRDRAPGYPGRGSAPARMSGRREAPARRQRPQPAGCGGSLARRRHGT